MEDTLGGDIFHNLKVTVPVVLILVLMEDTLGELENIFQKMLISLDPCSNGRYSRSTCNRLSYCCSLCLDPCSNGRYSRRAAINQAALSCKCVLILVLMEDTLGESKTYESFISEVLIIIRPTNLVFVNTN